MGNLLERLQRENRTGTFTVVITPTMETIYMTYLQIVGIISALLSILLIFLIIYRSPSQTSARLKFDMIALQICFLIFDVHVCCLFIPKSTLPYMGGYCMGLLCGTINSHAQFMFAIGVSLETLAVFFICLLRRYVTLTRSIRNPLVLNAIKAGSAVVAVIAPIEFIFLDLSKDRMIEYIEHFPKMIWLVEKNGWVLYMVSILRFYDRIAITFLFTVVTVFSGASVILIILISKYISKMPTTSSRSHSIHTLAIRNLILQFTVFSTFLSFPMMVIMFRLLFALDSGTMVFFISESILCSHGLANSIVALAFNSNFRRVITDQCSRNSMADRRPSLFGVHHRRPSIPLSR